MVKISLFQRSVWAFFVIVFCIGTISGQDELLDFYEDLERIYADHTEGHLVDYEAISNGQLTDQLYERIMSIEAVSKKERVAFLANAYNFLVIHKIVEQYPINSVLKSRGFFELKDIELLGKSYSLNDIEKDILQETKDERFHFALVCGAQDCPPVPFMIYRSDDLDDQLEIQTAQALSDTNFIRFDGMKYQVSEIFKWYKDDFGPDYLVELFPEMTTASYYPYDWTLNDLKAQGAVTNAARYVVSNTIQEGTTETKIFTNLYTETNQTNRTNYLTTQVGFLYGLSNQFNLGFDLRYRAVQINPEPAGPFAILKGQDPATSRRTVSTIGPKIRWTPLPEKFAQFSIQSAYWIPTGNTLESAENRAFLDWDGATWWTQFFYDRDIGLNFSLFAELDFIIEDIGNGDLNRKSTPATLILSYFPKPEITTYALINGSVFYQNPIGGFFQWGGGAKYQFNPNFELELLITKFYNGPEVSAATFNFGVRVNG